MQELGPLYSTVKLCVRGQTGEILIDIIRLFHATLFVLIAIKAKMDRITDVLDFGSNDVESNSCYCTRRIMAWGLTVTAAQETGACEISTPACKLIE